MFINLNMLKNTVVTFPSAKIIKKTQPVIENINEYMKTFVTIDNNFQELWNTVENQYNFRMFISEKKISMKKAKIVDDIARKEKIKEKIQKRKKIPEINNKPKHPYYFFKNEESIRIKEESPLLNKTDIHHELQKRWKTIKENDNDKFSYYNELAKNENLHREYLKSIEQPVIKNITKSLKTIRREKHEKKVQKKAEKKSQKIKSNFSHKNQQISKIIMDKKEENNKISIDKNVSTDKKETVPRFIDYRKNSLV